MCAFYAHTRPDQPESAWDLLIEHLQRTASTCETFCSAFDAPKAGKLAGLWHDLGKYQVEFQNYLRRNTIAGYQERNGPPHSIVGAYHASQQNLHELAMSIAAHHGRLKARADYFNDVERGAKYRITPPPSILKYGGIESAPQPARALWTRFLYSALVDADSLETERWDKGRPRWRCEKQPQDLLPALERYLAGLPAESNMSDIRRRVQQACRERSCKAPGPFRLTVPTGGGKTLASILFGLHHAALHGLRRVICVIPYTSIIDQTAEVYRDIFGDDVVLEHHSNIDPDQDNLTNRHCVENWDSPIIVTTSVQFFETLHANRKRDLRKLHNVARSVVILDEVQTFPLELIKPIKDALDLLTRHFHVTTVHCSATQPCLAQPHATEIIADTPALFSACTGRVKVHWPETLNQPASWEELAERITRNEQQRVLAIVHRRRDAIDLASAIGDKALHLSTLMCPAHRRHVLAQIKEKMGCKEDCIVVSTQLVEAGVDLDFPVVYRALAGVDSLAQAAGRCNREGAPAAGDFHVFVAPTQPPRGVLAEGMKEMKNLLREGERDLFSPDLPRRYFERLTAVYKKPSSIPAHESSLDFPKTAEEFVMIEDEGTPVIAPYEEESRRRIEDLRRAPGITAFRSLQPYTVSLRKKELDILKGRGCLAPLINGSEACWVVIPGFEHVYSTKFGFGGPESEILPLLDV